MRVKYHPTVGVMISNLFERTFIIVSKHCLFDSSNWWNDFSNL